MDAYITSLSNGRQITKDEIQSLTETENKDRIIVKLHDGTEHVVDGEFDNIAAFWER